MRVAAVQMDIAIGDRDKNLKNILLRMKEAAQKKAELVVFPECSLQGYCFPDREEAFALGEEISGPICTQLAQAAKESGCTAVIGFLERDGKNLFNSALHGRRSWRAGCASQDPPASSWGGPLHDSRRHSVSTLPG